jgi:hypothetical protein
MDERDLISPVDRDLISQDAPESFGNRMLRLKQQHGFPLSVNAGRRPIAERYKRQIGAAEKTFAGSLPELATEYVAELRPHDPERCPVHRHILCCPEPSCAEQSQRTAFNFKAASYVFDRIQGKPTTHVEATVTARFVEQLTVTLVNIFENVNGHDNATERRQAFAEQCRDLIAAWSGGGG